MAASYGIDAFCYYHYWFKGKRLLETPFQEVLESGKPAFFHSASAGLTNHGPAAMTGGAAKSSCRRLIRNKTISIMFDG